MGGGDKICPRGRGGRDLPYTEEGEIGEITPP